MNFMCLLLEKSISEGLTAYEENLYNQLCVTNTRQARLHELQLDRQIMQAKEDLTQQDLDSEEFGDDNQQTNVSEALE